MPREPSITYEEVAAIADTIKATGGKPSPRQIRERHGSGSLGTIHRLFQQWETGQGGHAERSAALPAPLQRAVLDFIAHEVAAARADLEAKLADALAAANDLATENERQARRVDTLEDTSEVLRGEKATLTGKVAQMAADLDAARDEAARERQAAEITRTELAKANLRLEAIPGLEKDIERLRKSIDAERAARTDAERLAATSEAKAAGLADRLADAHERHRQAVASLEGQLQEQKQRSMNFETELSATRKEARELATKLAEVMGELEGSRARNVPRRDADMNPAPRAETRDS
ncbi:mucin-associated surface protein [Aromatoleum toluvorans]|uniref:Mucin-associated surface protein n=1 Tax=Aromatoleum toluvorans TaxID=92002 RepID=A0ABX1PS79_9RHOO|nr:DNA-binding protein [Aromatoleum toluvorans]NMG42303.1 mucin-associated surface protein [Aromatoleum toluvorans]